MIFKILFYRHDACLGERKYVWLPVEAKTRDEAISIFDKFLGIPYRYRIIDVSVLDYEK